MIIGIGLEMCDLSKAKRSMEKGTYLATYYSMEEQNYFEMSGKTKNLVMAEHFAAKGAFLKLVGTGIVNANMSQIEILHDKYGHPYYNIKGWALEEMKNRNIDKITLSTTHSDDMAIAVAIAEKNP